MGASPGANITARQSNKDCSDFAGQAEAQTWLEAHAGDPDHLDADGNGQACESLGRAATTKAKTVAASRRARVIRVVDGDTDQDPHRRRVQRDGPAGRDRHAGERKRPQTPVECGAKRAAATLTKLLAGKPSSGWRQRPDADTIDESGRTLAYVDLGGRDAGETMVRTGWAKPYVYGGVPFERVSAYRAAESAARSAHAGVHGACAGDFHRAARA